jgi:hypothetical protein
MYSGFFVVSNVIDTASWHLDYHDGANAFTLITPLFDLLPEHGQLLYLDGTVPLDEVERAPKDGAKKYTYRVGEGILFGDCFAHTTEPYKESSSLRVLLSMTFGTDKMEYWPILRRTLENQTQFVIMPCGHRQGTCACDAG